ncbi:MAG: hypothetical protein E6G05_06095 [Actinobacteria bacterium]|nr:MAG: hypothetical protein E6G05_06095 [Actinomycetota bacterium]
MRRGRRSPVAAGGSQCRGYRPPRVPELPVLHHDAVLEAVSPAEAIERVREGLVRFHAGRWAMPPKIYLDSPPFGDFRAMPARGDGLALLKWVTSFPRNSSRGLPTVTGVICLSDASNGEPLMLIDARSVTALRTGGVAAVATAAASSGDAPGATISSSGRRFTMPRVSSAARARAARPPPRCRARSRLAGGGHRTRPRGIDGPGKSEASVGAVASCALFCDEWAQASHGGELTAAVTAGLIKREQVTELGAVLAGDAPGRPGPEAATLFDSTGLAVQDLAVAAGALEAWQAGTVSAQMVAL